MNWRPANRPATLGEHGRGGGAAGAAAVRTARRRSTCRKVALAMALRAALRRASSTAAGLTSTPISWRQARARVSPMDPVPQ